MKRMFADTSISEGAPDGNTPPAETEGPDYANREQPAMAARLNHMAAEKPERFILMRDLLSQRSSTHT